MSEYIALARKWRPKSLNDLVGQQHIIDFFKNSFAKQKIHHAYLLSGTRGVGKTSIARIIAKNLCCENTTEYLACSKCRTCKDIEDFRHLDVIEVDAASKTKVEDTREILDNLDYLPGEAKFKIYIIDEIHMLSKHSFNALLKSLEEPPSYVKFIFATTEPEKIPDTIKSRCVHLRLQSILTSDIEKRIEYITKEEQIKVDKEAVELIAKHAKGSMRDALSLLEQSCFTGENLTLESVQKMLGIVSHENIKLILQHVLNKDVNKAMDITRALVLNGFDSMSIVEQLLKVVYELILAKASGYTKNYEDSKNIFFDVSENVLHHIYQVILHSKEDVMISFDQTMALDVLIIRLIQYSPKKVALAPITEDFSDSNDFVENTANTKKNNFEKIRDVATNQDKIAINNIAQENGVITENESIPVTLEVKKDKDIEFIEKAQKDTKDIWFETFSKLDLQGVSKLVAKNSSLVIIKGNNWVFSINEKFKNLVSEHIIQTINKQICKVTKNENVLCSYEEHNTVGIVTPNDEINKKNRAIYEEKKQQVAKDEVSSSIMNKLNGKLIIKE